MQLTVTSQVGGMQPIATSHARGIPLATSSQVEGAHTIEKKI
jgi:hypothetical protein